MIRPVTFVSDVRFLIQQLHCICSRPGIHTQVVISLRLKELIEQKDWLYLRPEDFEEIRSLQELGFVVEISPESAFL